ncbi:hypothetical protein [Pannonibacter phragmitetus]|uniref:hypothetical protein n=1 Tax=Pannonibacter phragmitetus TaxID=121719 RepID=UPI003D2EBA0F
MRSFLMRGVSVSVMALALTHGALAFEATGNDVADAFLSRVEAGDVKVVSVGNVSEDGDQVTLEDVTLEGKTPEDGNGTIGIVTLTNGEEKSDGTMSLDGLSIEEAVLNDKDGSSVSMASLTLTGVVLPPADGSKSFEETADYSTIEAEGIKITEGDVTKATLDTVYAAINSREGNLPTSGELNLTGISVDVSEMDASTEKQLTDLGYETVNAEVAAEFKWDPVTGVLDLPKLDITAADMGGVALAVQIGGLTKEVAEKLEAAKDNSEEAMAIVQGLTLNSMRLRFDNGSIVDRLLDQQAKTAGSDRAAVVSQLKTGLPMMLALLQNPEFQTKVATAAGEFLDNPVSLQADAKPSAPVSVAQIFGTAVMAPQGLPQILGIDVTANKK